MVTEIIGTAVLVLGVLTILSPEASCLIRDSTPVSHHSLLACWTVHRLVLASLPVTPSTRRAISVPDSHFFLPIAGKGGSTGAAWVPVIGPILGGVLGALCYKHSGRLSVLSLLNLPKYILALDQGTPVRHCVRSTQVSSPALQEFRQIFPKPGWVEHDPEIWATQSMSPRGVLKAGLVATDIAAIGITNQRETTLVGAATGKPFAMPSSGRIAAGFCL